MRIATTASCCWLAVVTLLAASFLAIEAQPRSTHCGDGTIDPVPDHLDDHSAPSSERPRVEEIIDRADRILDTVEGYTQCERDLLRAGDLCSGLYPAAHFVTRQLGK